VGVELEELVARIRLDTSGLQAGLDQAGGAMSRAGSTMSRAGSTLTRGVTLPLVGIGVAATKLAADFDKNMRLVGIATGAPTEALSKLALQMGAETAFSAGEASAAMLELAKGGMTAAQIKGGALAATMKLAAAGGVELDVAATDVSNSMNAFGLEAKDANEVAVALAGAANASSASVDSLGQGLSQASLAAHNAGLSLQETTGVLSLFDAQGLKGSDAGTSLKTMLNALTPATDKARAAMDANNLSFVNADGSFKTIAQTAQILKDNLGGLTEAQRAQTLETIFGSDGVRAATILMNGGADAVRKYTAASKDNATTTALANAAMEGTSGAIERAKGSLETAAIVIGTVLAPYVQQLAGYIEQGANAFAALPAPVMGVVLAVAGLAAAIGPVLMILGAMSSGLGVLATILGAVSLPVVLVVAALAALGVAFYLAYTKSEEFRAGVQSALANLVSFVTGTVIPGLTAIGEQLVAAFNAAQPVIMQIVGIVRANLPQIAQIATQVFSTVATIITTTMTAVSAIIKATVAVVSALWDKFGGIILDTVSKVFPAMLQIISGALNVIQGLFRTIGAVLKGDWSGAWDGIKQILSGALQIIEGLLRASFAILIGIVKGSGTALKAAMGLAWDAVKAATSAAWDALVQAVIAGVKSTVDEIGKLPQQIVNAAAGWASILASVGGQLIMGMVHGVQAYAGQLLSAVGDAVGGAIDHAKSLLGIHSPSKVFEGIGKNVDEGFAKGIEENKDKPKHAAAELVTESTTAANAQAVAQAMRQLGRLLTDSFADGIAGGRDHVGEAFSHLMDLVKTINLASLTEIATGTRNALLALGSQWDKVHAQLVAAKNDLDALRSSAQQLTQSVTDAIVATGNLSQIQGQVVNTAAEGDAAQMTQLPVTIDDITGSLEAAVGQAQAFDEVIAALAAAGLNQEGLDQLIAAGPAASLAAAQAILAAGQSGIQQINALQAQLEAAGHSIGTQAADNMYAAGIAAAEGLIRGLQDREDALAKAMKRLVRIMIREIMEALDIHSPSRVMANLGGLTGEGFAVGLEGMAGRVQIAARTMAGAAVITPTDLRTMGNQVRSSVQIAAEASAPDVRVFIGDTELTDIVRTEFGNAVAPLRTITRTGAK
jgi:TP901 family phage tail tape measure protein